jgi:hypothetical protein
MAIALEEFLAHWEFRYHPFEACPDTEEHAELALYFVGSDCFDWLVARCRTPESVIMFADRGGGKTTLRHSLAARLSLRVNPAPLIISIDDLSSVLRGRHVQDVVIEDYLVLLRRLILEAVSKQLLADSFAHAGLSAHTDLYQDYLALLQCYAPRSSRGFSHPSAEALDMLRAEDTILGVKEWLLRLSELARIAGNAPIYCLIDAVDELDPTANDAQQALQLLASLLNAPTILGEAGITFVLFLPHSLHDLMSKSGGGRLDRIAHQMLTWNHNQLAMILNRRLQVSSSCLDRPMAPPRVSSLDTICMVGTRTEEMLCSAANGSPRLMLRLAANIIAAHLRRARVPSETIAEESVAEVLGALPLAAPQQRIATPEAPLIAIKPSGVIHIGDETRLLNLSRNQRTILEKLWAARPKRVSYEELIMTVYSRAAWEDLDQRDASRETLQRTLQRLKKLLEEGRGVEYIRVDIGLGYRMINTIDG